MSYDAMAGFVYAIDIDLIVEKVPSEYQSFLDHLEACGTDEDSFAMASLEGIDEETCLLMEGMFLDLDEEQEKPLVQSYLSLQEAFKRETGLEIRLEYVQEYEASRYNEVSGGVWSVVNAVQFTPEAQKFEDKINLLMFCVYG